MQLDTIDIRLLKVFVAIAESGGFAGAQAELGLTASTVSVHLSNLEKRLAVSLCHRGRRGFRLTEKGQSVYESARRLFLAMEDFRAETGSLVGQFVGRLSIGMADNILSDPRQPLDATIRRFHARAPRVHLNLAVDRPASLSQMLLDDRLHFALGAFPHKVSGLEYAHLYNEHHHLYCGVEHPLFNHEDDGRLAERVAQSDLVGRGYDLERDMRLTGAASHAATVENMEAQALLILSGGYIGFLPDHFAKPWVGNNCLKAIQPAVYQQVIPMYAVTREGKSKTQVLSAFLAELASVNASLNPDGNAL